MICRALRHGGSTDSTTPVVSLGIGAVIASSSAITYIPTCQPFPPHRRTTLAVAAAPATICLYRLRHTAVAAAAPAMISRGPRRSTVEVIVIVRNRSCDTTAAATVQHCRRSSSQPPRPLSSFGPELQRRLQYSAAAAARPPPLL